MILSHAHRFIYVKTFKTASTTVEAVLSECCGEDDVITPAQPELMKTRRGRQAQNYRLVHPLVPKRPWYKRWSGRPVSYYDPSVGFYEHMPADRIRRYVGEEIWRSYFKFSFERNPWQRQVSWYLFKTRGKSPRPDFDAFNRKRRRAVVGNYDLYSIDGDVALDFVGRYEHFADDFARVLGHLGLPAAAVPVTNVSAGQDRHWRDYYDGRSRELVAGWYAREIALFGYTFDGGVGDAWDSGAMGSRRE